MRGHRKTILLEPQVDWPPRGSHNLENVLAAAAAARLAGVDPPAIAEGVRTFAGVEHRIEYVATISGVEYFNDSKAINRGRHAQGAGCIFRAC